MSDGPNTREIIMLLSIVKKTTTPLVIRVIVLSVIKLGFEFVEGVGLVINSLSIRIYLPTKAVYM